MKNYLLPLTIKSKALQETSKRKIYFFSKQVSCPAPNFMFIEGRNFFLLLNYPNPEEPDCK